jgi:hypothetical protein
MSSFPYLTKPGGRLYDASKKITIHYHPYKRDEAMHGVGLRKKRGLNVCPAAMHAFEAQKQVHL